MAVRKFSRPTARIAFSDKLVVHVRNGRPVLEFRLANQRRAALSNAPTAHGETVGDTVHARHIWSAADVHHNVRFVDMVDSKSVSS